MRKHFTEKMMFRRTNEQEAGKWSRFHWIDCCDCGKSLRLHDASGIWLAPQKVTERFRAMAWDVGKDRRHDRCPTCAAIAKTLKTTKPEEAIPVSATPVPAPPPAPPPTPAMNIPPPRVPEPKPVRHVVRQANGRLYPPAIPGRTRRAYSTDGFTARWSAVNSAEKFLMKCGVSRPQEGQHYRVWCAADGFWSWRPVEEKPAPLTVEQFVRDALGDPEPAPQLDLQSTPKEETPAVPADMPREPTQAERRRVLDALDEHYLVEKGCYSKAFSDEALAAKLNVPRQWITWTRESFFGPDQNEQALLIASEAPALNARADKLEADAQDLRGLADTLMGEARGLRDAIAKLGAQFGLKLANLG